MAAHKRRFDIIDFCFDDRNRSSRRLLLTHVSPRVKTNTTRCLVKTITNAALSITSWLLFCCESTRRKQCTRHNHSTLTIMYCGHNTLKSSHNGRNIASVAEFCCRYNPTSVKMSLVCSPLYIITMLKICESEG